MRILTMVYVAFVSLGMSIQSGAQSPPNTATLQDFRVIQPDVVAISSDSEDFVLEFEGWGRNFTLELTENQQLLEHIPLAKRTALKAQGDQFYTGKLKGIADSWVRVNRIDGRIGGVFYDGSKLYLIDSPEGFEMASGLSAPPSATVLYRFSDLEFNGFIDHGGVPTGLPPQGSGDHKAFFGHLRATAQAGSVATMAMPITIVADTDFEDDLGASAESTAIGRLNFVDGIFASQLGVGLSLWHYEQLTDNGPLESTDSGELLSPQFRNFMISGDGSNIPFRGLAHLFTGRDLDGRTVGIAYIGALCSRAYGYGVDQNLSSETTSALVLAHELGHNFNAGHVDEGIMRPSVGGSQEFSDESLDVMTAAVENASCLVQGDAIIMIDGFED